MIHLLVCFVILMFYMDLFTSVLILINNLYEHNNYGHLVKKLCDKLVLPIINITKDKHKKCNCHCKQNNRKFVCLTDKYIEFCKEDSIILKKNYKIIF